MTKHLDEKEDAKIVREINLDFMRLDNLVHKKQFRYWVDKICKLRPKN